MFCPNTCAAISGASKVAPFGVKLITIAGIYATFLATFLFQRCTVHLVSGEGCSTLLITLRHRSNKKLTGSSLKAVKEILTIYRKTDQLSTSDIFFYNTYVIETTRQQNFFIVSPAIQLFLEYSSIIMSMCFCFSVSVRRDSITDLITDSSIMLMILQVHNR